MQGQPLGASKDAAGDAGLDVRDYRPPEGESWKDVNERAKDFLFNDIIKNYFLTDKKEEEEISSFDAKIRQIKPKQLNFLVVAHGGFIMEFTNAFKSIQDPQNHVDSSKNNSKNTSI